MKHPCLFALAAALTASCAQSQPGGSALPANPTVVAGAQCKAELAQFAIAQIADDALAQEARQRSGALRVRVVRPGEVITKELDTGRLTLEVGDHERVRRAYCG